MSRRRRRRFAYWEAEVPVPPRNRNRCRALLVIDNRPLQAAAWAELRRARQRLEKATRDLHRHEERDEPAFRVWLGATFPTLVSALRDLAQRVMSKAQIVEAVEFEAVMSGRSAARIWREWQQRGGKPGAAPGEDPADGAAARPSGFEDDAEEEFEKEMKRLFDEEGIPDDDPMADPFGDLGRTLFGLDGSRETKPGATDARAIYRRLVQHLHPDRGGEWTPARARVWEQVQAAWSERDVDWLSRLEAEWEASADLLGPTSPLGRLRAACAEIDAARRDAERRVRDYRKQDAWRFSLRPPSEELRVRLERQMQHERAMLERQLADVEAAISNWECTGTRGRRRNRRNRPDARQTGFGF